MRRTRTLLVGGTDDKRGGETFDVLICNPLWLAEDAGDDGFIIGRHRLIMNNFDYVKFEERIRAYLAKCVGATWHEVAEQVARLGHWEFEDYNKVELLPRERL